MPDTLDTGPVDSIASDLSAAFDTVEKSTAPDAAAPAAPAAPAKAATETPAPTETQSREDGRDEHGRFAKKAETTTDAPVSTETPAPATTTQPQALQAPEHWPAQDKELFAKQPPEVQQYLIARDKAMQGDYTKKTQEIAPVRRLKEQLDEILGPYRERYTMAGMDDAAAIRQLVAAHAYLERDPKAAIQHLATQYGINLQEVVQGTGDQSTVSPEVQAVQREVAQLRAAESQRLQAMSAQQHQASLAKVNSFAEEKDASGNLLRPHFDEVVAEVVALMKSGVSKDLQDAYDRAVYANPSTRGKVIAAQEAQRRATEETERKRKADEAKRASFDVKGTGGLGTPEIKPDSIRETLLSSWDSAAGRV